MRLRPRYSLLTLLVLTALVAGGVKLWYGPHRVVERVSPQKETEYTFTRQWNGNQIIQGPLIERTFDMEGIISSAEIMYFRNGLCLHLHKTSIGVDYFTYVLSLKGPFYCEHELIPEPFYNPLTEVEKKEFSRTVDRERQRLLIAGSKDELIEGYIFDD